MKIQISIGKAHIKNSTDLNLINLILDIIVSRCDRCQKYVTLPKHLSSHKDKCGTPSSSSQFDRMLSKYLKMMCDICGQSVMTLTGAIQHHWDRHKKVLGAVKCCDRKIPLHELNDHMKYHMDPDVYR